MSDYKLEIVKQLSESQSKYVYFLLAVAASAIAFSVQKTDGRTIECSMIPLAFAVLLWVGSFAAGCRNREYFQAALHANYGMLQLRDGTHPDTPHFPEEVDAAYAGVRGAANSNSEAAATWARWQFRLLVLGGLFFLLWHILEMILNTK